MGLGYVQLNASCTPCAPHQLTVRKHIPLACTSAGRGRLMLSAATPGRRYKFYLKHRPLGNRSRNDEGIKKALPKAPKFSTRSRYARGPIIRFRTPSHDNQVTLHCNRAPWKTKPRIRPTERCYSPYFLKVHDLQRPFAPLWLGLKNNPKLLPLQHDVSFAGRHA